MTDSVAPGFDDFWTASELSAVTRRRFAERMAAFGPSPSVLDPWSRPAPPVPAARMVGPLPELIMERRSTRRFSQQALESDDLGKLLSVLAGPIGGRGTPSAGALYPIRTITLRFAADRTAGQILQHDPVAHTLTEVGRCPGWGELVDDLAGQDAETAPAAIIGLYADASMILAKYGERGGRFVLIEAGAVLQNLALAAAALGLVGYPMGGASDRRMLALAGLSRQPARFVINYAVGHPD